METAIDITGATVVRLRSLEREDYQRLGLSPLQYQNAQVLVLRLPSGGYWDVYPMSDDEGNDTGAFFFEPNRTEQRAPAPERAK